MQRPLSRRRFLGAAVASTAAVAGCSGGSAPGDVAADGSPSGTEAPSSATPSATSGGTGPPTAETSLPVHDSFEKLRQEVVSGGPPKDGIPSIDDPSFVPADEAPSWLDPQDVVFGVVRGDDVKAYPQEVLVWHEICNDTLDGDPVSVTYCPLTGTAMGFDRGATTFGVSGNLVNNNLIMYDRATDSRWPQVLATAIEGPFEGSALREFRLVWTTWERWKAAHPDTQLLSADTGYARNYGSDPYGSYNPDKGYYNRQSTLFPVLNPDDRMPLKEVVVGSRTDSTAVAFKLTRLREEGWLTASASDGTYLAVYDGPLDTAYVYRDAGDASVESVSGGEVTLGDGSTHPASDLPFPGSYAFEGMWFAWSGFYPGTVIGG